ncbi:hypothetical protein HPB48_013338 [Haemaphysalis longicornis]|uniref:Uncharacterized protein n=1 Tax=Haemaphysalis longicornis TaxID=44386 RepID=A0A9J6FR74_HAELO|nr:hypothetical protein HPB48_013338 [Haemaphysalis longicornis]
MKSVANSQVDPDESEAAPSDPAAQEELAAEASPAQPLVAVGPDGHPSSSATSGASSQAVCSTQRRSARAVARRASVDVGQSVKQETFSVERSWSSRPLSEQAPTNNQFENQDDNKANNSAEDAAPPKNGATGSRNAASPSPAQEELVPSTPVTPSPSDSDVTEKQWRQKEDDEDTVKGALVETDAEARQLVLRGKHPIGIPAPAKAIPKPGALVYKSAAGQDATNHARPSYGRAEPVTDADDHASQEHTKPFMKTDMNSKEKELRPKVSHSDRGNNCRPHPGCSAWISSQREHTPTIPSFPRCRRRSSREPALHCPLSAHFPQEHSPAESAAANGTQSAALTAVVARRQRTLVASVHRSEATPRGIAAHTACNPRPAAEPRTTGSLLVDRPCAPSSRAQNAHIFAETPRF